MSTVVIVVAVLVALGSYLMWLAGRLDRLAVRVESARASLEAQLARRAAAATELATTMGARGAPGPWTDLHDAAALALADRTGGEAPESALTRAIRAAVAVAPQEAEPLVATATRVRFARQFHNDAVHASLALRRRRVIRWLRLWGTAKAPSYFEIDDTVA